LFVVRSHRNWVHEPVAPPSDGQKEVHQMAKNIAIPGFSLKMAAKVSKSG
jgi:hypothetical protein